MSNSVRILDKDETAAKIVDDILDRGMAKSTWRSVYPKAYENILLYRRDMIASIIQILDEADG